MTITPRRRSHVRFYTASVPAKTNISDYKTATTAAAATRISQRRTRSTGPAHDRENPFTGATVPAGSVYRSNYVNNNFNRIYIIIIIIRVADRHHTHTHTRVILGRRWLYVYTVYTHTYIIIIIVVIGNCGYRAVHPIWWYAVQSVTRNGRDDDDVMLLQIRFGNGAETVGEINQRFRVLIKFVFVRL
jgi:hypothetical protein